MKWADYCISKLSLTDNGLIDTVTCFDDLGDKIGNEFQRQRTWMVQQINSGKTFCSITKNTEGSWNKLNEFTYVSERFAWGTIIPKDTPKRKTFVSYYHRDDQVYKERFEKLFGDLVTNKSVGDGDIDSDNSDEYIKQLIQKDYLSDTTVLVVLVGAKTKCRKHVDWEISAALNMKVGRYSGLLALFLPTHPSFNIETVSRDTVHPRLYDNIVSKYAIAADWTDDRVQLQKYIEQAFAMKNETDRIKNDAIQMQRNTCE